MTPAARLQAVIDLLDAQAKSPRPVDVDTATYFRGRRYIGAKDRRAISERLYGILRRRARLGWWLERAHSPHTDGRAMVMADLAITDRMVPDMVAELFSGWDTHGPRPLSAEDVTLLQALNGKPLFHDEMPAWVRGEYPEWTETVWQSLFGERAAAEIGVMRDEAPVDLRVNTLKADRKTALRSLREAGVAARETRYSPLGLRLEKRTALTALEAFRQGWVEVQDEGSQLVAFLCEVEPGMQVVDFCAGAGGKTLALAAFLGNKGRLFACDTVKERLDRSAERLRRAGVDTVVRQHLSGENDKWVKRNARRFDRVLVDAPCSGTGTWRRNPDAKWRLTPQDVAELSGLQARILKSASGLVKPGGAIVYATCSLLPEENEHVVEGFLAGNPDFCPVPLSEVWKRTPGGEAPCPDPWLRLSPATHGTDGFFAAVLKRVEQA